MQNIALQQKVENFSRLSDQECALFLQGHLLEALEIEDPTYLECEILAKFIGVEYSMREDLCKLFKYYLKRNVQVIAGVPVNVWLKRYLIKYAGIGRDPDTFFRYASTDPEIRKLSEKDQIKLMRIFRIYDYFLIEPIASMDDVAAENIMRFPMYLSESLQEIKTQMSSIAAVPKVSVGTISERLTIKQAVQKYPKLGEQMVTNSPIKLKNFDRPVRPLVRNWVYDYTSHLGQTGHTSMDRTNYLFRSENGSRLTSQEREKLGIILKSFDENTPIGVDGERQEIVFNEQRTMTSEQYHPAMPSVPRVMPQPLKTQQQTFVRPYPQPQTKLPAQPQPTQNKIPDTRYQIPDTDKIQFVNPYPSPVSRDSQHSEYDDNIANVRFSEGMPKKYEPPVKTVSQSSAFPSREPVSRDSSKPSFSRNIIRPHFGPQEEKNPEPKIEGNIVDLRGDQQ